MVRYELEEPLCSICGLSVGFYTRQERTWQGIAIVMQGPRHADSNEQLSWCRATGYPYQGLSHFTQLPSRRPVLIHSSYRYSPTLAVRSDYHFLDFHCACISIAYRVILTSPINSLYHIKDVWNTLNQRYRNGPPSEEYWDDVPPIPQKTAQGKCYWTRYPAYYLPTYPHSRKFEWVGVESVLVNPFSLLTCISGLLIQSLFPTLRPAYSTTYRAVQRLRQLKSLRFRTISRIFRKNCMIR